jgi:D-alanyl-D-alanine carboxypeptidase/D-alanyl-D-alanine-endopeptidase (penicillin-binding protein 4)
MPVRTFWIGMLLAACAVALDAHAARSPLPADVRAAFAIAGIPMTGLAVYIQEVGAKRPLFTHRAQVAMNPASTMKLVTTYAALDLLGPDYTWKTEIYTDGTIEGDVLKGNLYLKGYGDPKITYEAFTALLQKLRAAGVRDIHGDLVQDRSFFAGTGIDPARFDNEPLKPYNVGPDALLVDFKSIRFIFTPDAGQQRVLVRAEPHPSNLTLTASLTLSGAACGDWRPGVGARFAGDSNRASALFAGSYPMDCGEQDWFVSMFDHAHYVDGTFRQVWHDIGGSISGDAREARVPSGARLLAVQESPPLSDIVYDVNKFSNNVMARQLFLALATVDHAPPAQTKIARETVKRWLRKKGAHFPELVLENGSGLSRTERISAEHLARLLGSAYAAPFMVQYIASLPVAAADGTMRKRLHDSSAAGQAFLKTGSLEGVRALAGYLLNEQGRCFVLVAFVNHRNAAGAQGALDALVQWVYRKTSAAQTR